MLSLLVLVLAGWLAWIYRAQIPGVVSNVVDAVKWVVSLFKKNPPAPPAAPAAPTPPAPPAA